MWVRAKHCQRYAGKIPSDYSQSVICFWTRDRNHRALWQREPRALLACHLISFGYFQLKEKQRKEIDRGQSNYIHLYTPSCLISSAWEGESREGEDETDESLPEAWDLLCFRQGFRSGRLPVHKVSHNHEDTLIQPGLSHGTPTSGSSRYEM